MSYKNSSWVIGRKVDSQVVSNTTALTSIFSVALPADALLPDRVLRITHSGMCTNNSGVTRTMNVRIALGATVIYLDTTAAIATGTLITPVYMQLLLASDNGASAAQNGGGVIIIGSTTGATTGSGDLATDEIAATTPIAFNAAAVNMSTPQTLDISIQHSVANANITYTHQVTLAELI